MIFLISSLFLLSFLALWGSQTLLWRNSHDHAIIAAMILRWFGIFGLLTASLCAWA